MNKHINNWIQLDTISTYQITSIHISDQAWPGSCCCEHTQFPVPSAVVLIGQNIYSRSPESYVSYEFRRYRKLLPLTLTSCCPCSLQSLGVKSITQPLICATHGNRGDMRRWRKMLDNLWQIEKLNCSFVTSSSQLYRIVQRRNWSDPSPLSGSRGLWIIIHVLGEGNVLKDMFLMVFEFVWICSVSFRIVFCSSSECCVMDGRRLRLWPLLLLLGVIQLEEVSFVGRAQSKTDMTNW